MTVIVCRRCYQEYDEEPEFCKGCGSSSFHDLTLSDDEVDARHWSATEDAQMDEHYHHLND